MTNVLIYKTNIFSPLKNPRGQTLVQALVTAAIMSATALAFATALEFQSRESRALAEKLAVLDLSRSLTLAVSSSATCNGIVASTNMVSSSAGTFDATNISPTQPYTITLKDIPNLVSSGGLVASHISKSARLLPFTGSTPGIQIKIASITPPSATLILNLDQTNLIRPLRNITLANIPLQISGATNSTTIDGCGGSNPGGASSSGSMLCIRTVGGAANTTNCFDQKKGSVCLHSDGGASWYCGRSTTGWIGDLTWNCSTDSVGFTCVNPANGSLCSLPVDVATGKTLTWSCTTAGGWSS